MTGVFLLTLWVAAAGAALGSGLGGAPTASPGPRGFEDRVATVRWPGGPPGGALRVGPWTAHPGAGAVCGRDLLASADGASPPESQRTEPARSWVTHTVLPGETLEMIAARYGTTVAGLRLANRPRGARAAQAAPGAGLAKRPRPGRKLRVYARRVPAPRERVEHTVEAGDTWVSLSVRYHVRYRELRAWNWRVRTLRPGARLTVWVDPARPRTVFTPDLLRAAPPLPELVVPAAAKSRGRTQRGWLEDGVRLPDCGGPEAPDCPLYTLKVPHYDWGSSYAVRAFLDAVSHFRHDSGFRGPLCVGSMSRHHGGPFAPHASHRTGRDVDIFLPLLPWVPFTWEPTPFEVDWAATWGLLKALDATGAVEMIFLDIRVQPFLYEAGRQLGASPEELGRLIQFPRPVQDDGGALVRHGKDHTRHIHVRFRCAPDEDRCYSKWGDERFFAIQRADKAAERAQETAARAARRARQAARRAAKEAARRAD